MKWQNQRKNGPQQTDQSLKEIKTPLHGASNTLLQNQQKQTSSHLSLKTRLNIFHVLVIRRFHFSLNFLLQSHFDLLTVVIKI